MPQIVLLEVRIFQKQLLPRAVLTKTIDHAKISDHAVRFLIHSNSDQTHELGIVVRAEIDPDPKRVIYSAH